MTHRPDRTLPALWAALLLPLAAGCGLSTYEAKLAAEQERLKRYDEDNQYLGNPLDVPDLRQAQPGSEPPLAEYFLRPPKGVAAKSDGRPLEGFFRFPGPPPADPNNPPTASAEVIDGFRDVYVAFTTDGKADVIRANIQKAFPGAKSEGVRAVSAPGRPTLQFELLTLAEARNPPSTCQIYFHQNGPYVTAIVYRVDQGKLNTPSASNAIKFGLLTLAMGPNATAFRQSFRSR